MYARFNTRVNTLLYIRALIGGSLPGAADGVRGAARRGVGSDGVRGAARPGVGAASRGGIFPRRRGAGGLQGA